MSPNAKKLIQRFEDAVKANGYRTISDASQREYEEAKSALISLISELEQLRAEKEAMRKALEWKKVPAEATKELLTDASSKQAGDTQVLCYEKGAYYNAWLVFDEYEGGWIWMNEADSEPNPSHYCTLPSPPTLPTTSTEEGVEG